MPQALLMPQVGESVTEGTVIRWIKAEGESIKVDEPLVEIETEKVNVEVPSPFAGVLTKILVAEGATVAVGEQLALIEAAPPAPAGVGRNGAPRAGAAAPPPPAAAPPAAAPPPPPEAARVASAPSRPAEATRAAPAGGMAGFYSPVVQRLARERGVELAQVTGTGAGGRVTRKDVLAFTPQAAPAAPPSRVEGEAMPLSATRRTIGERMLRSVQTAPHAWLMVEVDVSNLVRLREEAKERFRRAEHVDLTYLPFFIKAVVEGLKEHPRLNSSWTEEGMVLRPEINVGVAVATDDGLLVPVVHNADRLSIAGLAHELTALATKARERRLRIEDVQGGTFTVDNTGAFGSVLSKPIINPPQAAIITMETIVRRPVVTDGDAIAVRSMLNVCCSFDHRLLDGADAGRFLATVKERLESYRPDTPLY